VSKACDYVADRMSAYIDNTLSNEEKRLIEEELANCEECRKKLEFMQSISEVAGSMPKITASKDFSSSLHARLLQEQQAMKMPKTRNIWKPLSGFAAVAAVLALSVITLNSLPQHPELTSEETTKPTPTFTAVQQERAGEELELADTEKVEKTPLPESTAEASSAKVQPKEEKPIQQNENEKRIESKSASVSLHAPVEQNENELETSVSSDRQAELKQDAMEKAPQSDEFAEKPAKVEKAEETPIMASESAEAQPAPAAETVEPQGARIVSGGGGSAMYRASVEGEIVEREIYHYSFNPEDFEKAREYISRFSQNGEVWVVPMADQAEVQAFFKSLSGFYGMEMRIEPIEEVASEIGSHYVVLHVE